MLLGRCQFDDKRVGRVCWTCCWVDVLGRCQFDDQGRWLSINTIIDQVSSFVFLFLNCSLTVFDFSGLLFRSHGDVSFNTPYPQLPSHHC